MASPSEALIRGCRLLVLALVTCGGCASVRPSNDRDWSADQAILSQAKFDGDLVHVRNIRNCDYRTADVYTVRHYDKTFDLRRLQSVDFIMVPFSDMPGGAHTFLSFGFDGDDYVAVSVEVRKEEGEKYQPLAGMLRQYEIMYVVGDERDLVGLRANHRKDDVFIYRVRTRPDKVRSLFVQVMERVNKLAQEPEFYNTLTNNCTTNILAHVNSVAETPIPYGYQVLLPGYSDRLAYDLGLLDTRQSFERTRQDARVNQWAYLYRDSPDFSRQIRR